MATQTQAQAESQAVKDPFGEMRLKAFETMSAYSKANQRVLGELINLSSAAVQETVRMYGELESAALEAARTAPGFPFAPALTLDDLTKDPVGGYRQGALAIGEAPQRLLKLLDRNTQIIGQGAQRFQASAERTGKEIQDAITSYFNRIEEIYRRG